jgi:CobQ-like glutamine amidotransferase family enzyme
VTTAGAPKRAARRLRIVHLFPDLLNVYGDLGNVRTVVVRSELRGLVPEIDAVRTGAASVPPADLFLIGGGQDREQVVVARELERLGPAIRDQIADGAALLAVCGGYQNLGWSYRTAAETVIDGPGLLDIRTVAGTRRLVGPVIARITEPLPPDGRSGRDGLVGFENHSGRTYLGPTSRPLARVEIGRGNNGEDGGEGILALPGEGGLSGLRVGTYLHGPLLPRNPHLADALIAAALGRGRETVELAALDDDDEWRAHDHYATRTRSRRRRDERLPGWLRRVVDPVRSLIGF